MLSPDDIVEGIEALAPRYRPTQALLSVHAELPGIVDEDTDPLTWQQFLTDAIGDGEVDPYCEALRLNIAISASGRTLLADESRPQHLRGALEHLVRLAQMCREPVLGYWIADTAVDLHWELKPAYAAEALMLALRLGCRLESKSDIGVPFFVRSLNSTRNQSPSLERYLVPARRELARRLSTLVDSPALPMIELAEAHSLATLALADAEDGRRQGVMFHAAGLDSFVDSYTGRYPSVREGAHPTSEEDCFGLVWESSHLGDPFRVLADAYLLVGEWPMAIQAMARAADLDPYEGATPDLELLRRLLTRCTGEYGTPNDGR